MKFLIIDDEVYTAGFESILEIFAEIYNNVFGQDPLFHLDPAINKDIISSKIPFEDNPENSHIICTNDPLFLKDLPQITLISIDLTNKSGSSYIKHLEKTLGEKKPVYVIALTGDMKTHLDTMELYKKEYPYFEYVKKDNFIDDTPMRETIQQGCKAISILCNTTCELIEKVKELQSNLYPEFLQNSDIISNVDNESGERYITTILKESLYNGEYLDTKHQYFESYIPVYKKEISLVRSPNKESRQNDSDVRFGLIVQKDSISYIYISPSCNMHGIKSGKIKHVQLLELKDGVSNSSPSNPSDPLIVLKKSTTDSDIYQHIDPINFDSECVVLKKQNKIPESEQQQYLIKKTQELDNTNPLQGFKIEAYSINPSLSQYLCEIVKYNTPGKFWSMNFTDIRNIPIEEFCADYTKQAILVESVAKDVQHKFSSYYGRPGSIDFHKSNI